VLRWVFMDHRYRDKKVVGVFVRFFVHRFSPLPSTRIWKRKYFIGGALRTRAIPLSPILRGCDLETSGRRNKLGTILR
jgi:hypothetical protein